MMHLVTGGSGSGKSAWAEAKALELWNGRGKLYYIATMEPFGEETLEKIRRHRCLRAGKGFETLECYTDLRAAAETLRAAGASEGEKPTVLLECMSNLAANELYSPAGAGDHAAARILDGTEALAEVCRSLVIVTNEVFSGDIDLSPEMIRYQQVLAEINRRLAARADAVTEVVYGIPVEVKQ